MKCHYSCTIDLYMGLIVSAILFSELMRLNVFLLGWNVEGSWASKEKGGISLQTPGSLKNSGRGVFGVGGGGEDFQIVLPFIIPHGSTGCHYSKYNSKMAGPYFGNESTKTWSPPDKLCRKKWHKWTNQPTDKTLTTLAWGLNELQEQRMLTAV